MFFHIVIGGCRNDNYRCFFNEEVLQERGYVICLILLCLYTPGISVPPRVRNFTYLAD